MWLLHAHQRLELPALDLTDSFLFIVAGALVTHLIYKKYEVPPSSYIPTFLLLCLIPYLCSSFLVQHFSSPVLAYATGFPCFYVSLLTSIACYRLSPWHPLAKYPGPVLARLTKFWSVYHLIKGDYLHLIAEIHKRHGPYVRTGPNELSFADADLVPAIFAPDMPKGPMWDGRRHPDAEPSLIATRSSKEHAEKRIFWAHAMNSSSVRELQPTIVRRTVQLAEELEKRTSTGQSINLVKWLSYFAFDFMADMAFGGGFELMRDDDSMGFWKLLEDRVVDLAWQWQLPWATRIFLKIPAISGKVTKFRNFTIQCASARMKNGANSKDLFYYLCNESNNVKRTPSLEQIVVNGELAVVAGSDTTSTALSGLFYYLLTHPECYKRLQKEVAAVFPPGEGDPMDATRLSEMKYLNAVINESLRLQPAVLTQLHRSPEKGSGGKWIGNHFIRQDTAVNVPPYVMHRDPRYFSPNPEEFWPERWLQDQTFVSTSEKSQPAIMNTAAYIPFSAGNRNCAGKNLAIAEMRASIAMLMYRFEMRFADGFDPRQYENTFQDRFIAKPGDLFVNLTPRA